MSSPASWKKSQQKKDLSKEKISKEKTFSKIRHPQTFSKGKTLKEKTFFISSRSLCSRFSGELIFENVFSCELTFGKKISRVCELFWK